MCDTQSGTVNTKIVMNVKNNATVITSVIFNIIQENCL